VRRVAECVFAEIHLWGRNPGDPPRSLKGLAWCAAASSTTTVRGAGWLGAGHAATTQAEHEASRLRHRRAKSHSCVRACCRPDAVGHFRGRGVGKLVLDQSEEAAGRGHTLATLPSDPATLHPMTQAAATEAELRELDVAIDTAVSALDAATLDRLLADNFVYTHAGGKSEPKREFIATAVGRADPPRRSLHDLQVEPHGDIAVTRGTIEFIYADARPNLYLGYVRVHRLFDSGWQAISHRSFYVVDRG
jgi:hypothetical protein